jgi:hypothetical protein
MLAEWWGAVPGAQAAYDYVVDKWRTWQDGGRSLASLQDTASAVTRFADTDAQRSQAATIGAEVGQLRVMWNDWNPRLQWALDAIRNAFGLGALPVLAMTLVVAGGAVVAAFLTRRSGAERSLLALVDTLSPQAREQVARDLAGKVSGRGFMEALGDAAGVVLVLGGGLLVWSYFGRGRAS